MTEWKPVPGVFRAEAEDFSNLQEQLKKQGVKYALGSYVDTHGLSKSKMVPIDYLNGMMQGSELYTVTALEAMGGSGPQDDECQAVPDPASATILPWKRDVAWFASDLYYHGEPYPYSSRVVLKRVLAQARAQGFNFMLGVEPEFYVLREEGGKLLPLAPDDNLVMPGYDVRSTLHSLSYLDAMVEHMNELGWDVHSFDHEGGNGQYEFDFSFSEALTQSDRLTFLRLMAGEVARQFGAFACFMPKPFSDNFGSGAHFNMSLFETGTSRNAFVDPKDPRGNGLSPTAYSFIAGLLRHAEALTAISAPLVNSYKRLIARGMMPDMTWAPVYIAYGRNNRSSMFRVPRNRPAVENRVPDISCNFYLAAAMHLAAGLEGIAEGLDPGDPVDLNLYEVPDEELGQMSVRTLPRTLLEAVDAFDASPLAERVMGTTFKKEWVKLKRREWAEYHLRVTDFERERYLKFY